MHKGKYDCDDIEPTNEEYLAQTKAVKSKKSAKQYQMLLSGETNTVDIIDYFPFDLKSTKKIKVTASSKPTDRIRILIKKKTAAGTEMINTKESEKTLFHIQPKMHYRKERTISWYGWMTVKTYRYPTRFRQLRWISRNIFHPSIEYHIKT